MAAFMLIIERGLNSAGVFLVLHGAEAKFVHPTAHSFLVDLTRSAIVNDCHT